MLVRNQSIKQLFLAVAGVGGDAAGDVGDAVVMLVILLVGAGAVW